MFSQSENPPYFGDMSCTEIGAFLGVKETLGQHEEAKTDFAKATELEPDFEKHP